MMFVVTQQRTMVPNQEIVLEFTDGEVTSLEAQKAIEIVKKQLQAIGVDNIRISKELNNGTLKIEYYSDSDVAFIKNLLSKEQNIALGHVFYDLNEDNNQPPLNQSSKDFNLDVHEIQKSTDFNTDFNGLSILEIHQEQKGASDTSLHSFIASESSGIDGLIEVAQKIHTDIALAIDNTSYNIPEVRAGPIS